MSLHVLGINHNNATVAVREKVAFAPEHMQEALQQACAKAGIAEIAILSTCNRTELYYVPASPPDGSSAADVAQPNLSTAAAQQQVQQHALNWLCNYHQLAPTDISDVIYGYQDVEAVKHLMRVASGLDSITGIARSSARRTNSGMAAGSCPILAVKRTGFCEATSHWAIVRASSGSGQVGRARPMRSRVGKRATPGKGSIAVSRGMQRKTGP